MADSSLPLRLSLPARADTAELAGTPVQQAFRQAIQAIETLREQLHTLRSAQTATRQAYWRQVGPLAADTVAARRALYAPLEEALLSGYLSRAEAQQVTELLVHNARSLQERFGEDESAILARYAPAPQPASSPTPPPPTDLLPHEQAEAAARARRQQRTQKAQEAEARQADVAGQALLQNTKTAYRQLARLHHPDRAALADTATQQAQTELMQRITAAYAAGDLAALLALLADTPTSTAPTAEALLRRYTHSLAQQQAQLSQQLAEAQRPLADAPWSGTEKQQRTRLREIKRSLRDETAYLARLLRYLREPTDLRNWLREVLDSGQAGF